MSDTLKPSVALLVKLGSALVHADEMLSEHGHPFDREALMQLVRDPEVTAWLKAMDKMAFLPRKRNL